MLILPGEKLSEKPSDMDGFISECFDGNSIGRYVYDTEKQRILFYEPLPTIGMSAECIIENVSILCLDLKIIQLNGYTLGINHKAVYKLSFINQDEGARFLPYDYKKGDTFRGIIDGFCDQKGILIRKE